MSNRLLKRHPAPPNGAGGAAADADRRPAPPAGLLPLLIDLRSLAALLSVSTRTAKRLAADGSLPAGAVVRLGRRRLFSRPVVERWCAEGCPRPRGRAGA